MRRMYIQHDAGDESKAQIYTLYGNGDDAMIVPPGFQEPAPFGADLGGVSPAFYAFMPGAEVDSWLTVSHAEGNTDPSLSSIGIDWTVWTDIEGLTIGDGAIFFMEPSAAPLPIPADGSEATLPVSAGSKTLVAQLTVATGSRFLLSTSCQGRSTDAGVPDWSVTGLYFTVGAAWVGDCWAEQYTHCGTPCELGTADSDADGTTPCEHCIAGKYAGENADGCVPCASNTYDDDGSAATPCVPCPEGTASAAGATECAPRRCTSGLSLDNSVSICAGVVGDECSFQCSEGYAASGAHVCAEDAGTAAFVGGSCEPVTCEGSPPAAVDGVTAAATGCDAGPYTFQGACDYSCPAGYRPQGLHVCGADGAMSGGSCTALTAVCEDDAAAACPTYSTCDLVNDSPVCICAPGTYATGLGDGQSATGCQTVTACADGTEYEVTAPTEIADRVCGTVNVCGVGESTVSAATPTQDAVCATCAPGTFASGAGVCEPCPEGTFDIDGDSTTECEATEEVVAPALFATIGGAISEGDFITAAAAAAGDGVSAEDIQVTSFVQTIPATAAVPGAVDDYADLVDGDAARQFRSGVASAAGVSTSDVTITEVTGNRRRRMETAEAAAAAAAAAARRVLQSGTVSVEFELAAPMDISAVVTDSSWSSTLATSINNAGDAIATVEPDMFPAVAPTDIETAVTFTTTGSAASAQVDTAALGTQVALVVPDAALSFQPTVIMAASVPPGCDPGNELNAQRTGCVPCPPGQADLDGSGSTPCDVCPVGTQALGDATGTRACTVCPNDYADHDADPATACEKPHIVATSVLLDGAADRDAVRAVLSTTTQIHLENVEFVAWVESIEGVIVLRAPGLATTRPENFVASFTDSFALSLDLPRNEITSVEVASGCDVIMSDAGQVDADDCITVSYSVEADHEVAVSVMLTDTYPAALALQLRGSTGIDAIGAWGQETTTVAVGSLRTSVDWVVLCPSTTEAELVTERLSDLASLPWGVGVTVVESVAAEIITDENAELRPPPPPPPTCEGFDCSGSDNSLDAAPAAITCAITPCSDAECCTVEPEARPPPPPDDTAAGTPTPTPGPAVEEEEEEPAAAADPGPTPAPAATPAPAGSGATMQARPAALSMALALALVVVTLRGDACVLL